MFIMFINIKRTKSIRILSEKYVVSKQQSVDRIWVYTKLYTNSGLGEGYINLTRYHGIIN